MSKLGVGGPGDGASGRGPTYDVDADGDEACQPTPGSDENEVMPQFRDVLLDIDPADPWYEVAVPRRGWRARAPVLTRDQE